MTADDRETIQQVYSNTSKVMVDAKGGNNLLYLPLDKLIQATAAPAALAAPVEAPAAAARSAVIPPVSADVPPQLEKAPPVETGGDYHARSSLDSRERGGR